MDFSIIAYNFYQSGFSYFDGSNAQKHLFIFLGTDKIMWFWWAFMLYLVVWNELISLHQYVIWFGLVPVVSFALGIGQWMDLSC